VSASKFVKLRARDCVYVYSALVFRVPMPPGMSWIFFLKIPEPVKKEKKRGNPECSRVLDRCVTHADI